MELSVLGIDLAKDVFQLHGNDLSGRVVLRKSVRRSKFKELMANLPYCTVAMEACSSAHYWAREFEKMGHAVRLIAPQFVKPFVKANKHDAADAEAIAEAAIRPSMRFVPIKRAWQQDIQSIHRVRQRLVRNRTALVNELRGLLAEYGFHVSRGRAALTKLPSRLASEEAEQLTPEMRQIALDLIDELKQTDCRIAMFDQKIERAFDQYEPCKRIAEIPGVGPVTATAVVGAIGDPKTFKNGRQFAAWLGLVPKQHSSGGKTVLLGISKRGDGYLRRLLVHGARSAIRNAHRKDTRRNRWIKEKVLTRGTNKACVALANRNARTVWALLAKGESYQAA